MKTFSRLLFILPLWMVYINCSAQRTMELKKIIAADSLTYQKVDSLIFVGEELTSEIQYFKNLSHLFIGYDGRLDHLPKEMVQLQKLKSLDISINVSLDTIPDYLFDIVTLERLTFSKCFAFTEIPPRISHLKNLKILSLYRTSIQRLPKEITELQSLEKLYLTENTRLKSLPEEIVNISSLRLLVLDKKYKKQIGEKIRAKLPATEVRWE